MDEARIGVEGDESRILWTKCKDFHGHECPGLSIGYRAALYARILLGIDKSEDEDIVCIAENDSCAVDAVQVILSTTLGKGNLKFHMTGKQAFSFYDRNSGKSIRLVYRAMNYDDIFVALHTLPAEDLFDVKETTLPLPQKARLYGRSVCAVCHETCGDKWIVEKNGRKLCIDCFEKES